MGPAPVSFSYFARAYSGGLLYTSRGDQLLAIDSLTAQVVSSSVSIPDMRAMGAAPVPLPATAALLFGAISLLGALGFRRVRS